MDVGKSWVPSKMLQNCFRAFYSSFKIVRFCSLVEKMLDIFGVFRTMSKSEGGWKICAVSIVKNVARNESPHPVAIINKHSLRCERAIIMYVKFWWTTGSFITSLLLCNIYNEIVCYEKLNIFNCPALVQWHEYFMY